MKHNTGFIVLAVLVLAGCTNSSQIQTRYSSQQDTCREEAVKFSSSAAAADPNAAESSAGLRFSECMNRTGWRVSMPKPAQTANNGPAPNPPSGSPSTNPIASAASAPAPVQQAATPVMAPPVQQQASTPVYPPSGAPSTAPSAAAARYQPARPTTVQAPAYGSGAGRQF